MLSQLRKFSLGLTTTELLLGTALLVVLLSITQFPEDDPVAEAEMATALERVEACVKAARIASRIYNTDVILHLSPDRVGKDYMYYSVPASQRASQLLEYSNVGCRIPESVQIRAKLDVILLNQNGVAETPVSLVLTSTKDDSLREKFLLK